MRTSVWCVALVVGCSDPGEGPDAGGMVCPEIIPETHDVVAAIECVPTPCLERFSQRGCKIDVDLRGCGAESAEVNVGPEGELSIGGQCEQLPAKRGSFLSYLCQGCTIDTFAVPQEPDLPVDVERISLFAGMRPLQNDRVDGFITDLTLVDGEVVISTLERNFGTEACAVGNRTTRIVRIDADTMTPTNSATIAGCILRIAKHPVRSELFGLSTEPRRVLRFDLDGRVLAERPLEERVEVIAPWSTPPQVVVATRGSVDSSATATITFLHADTLEVEAHYDAESPKVTALLAEPPRLSIGVNNAIVTLNPGVGFVDRITIGTDELLDSDASLLLRSVQGTLVASSFGRRAGVYALGPERLDSGFFYEREAAMTAAAPWVGDSTLLLAGIHARDTGAALLSFLVAESPHFLPGSIEIGFGPVHAMVERDGRYFAVLPWAGEVVKITPR